MKAHRYPGRRAKQCGVLGEQLGFSVGLQILAVSTHDDRQAMPARSANPSSVGTIVTHFAL